MSVYLVAAVWALRADSSDHQRIPSAILADAQLAVNVHVVKPASMRAAKGRFGEDACVRERTSR